MKRYGYHRTTQSIHYRYSQALSKRHLHLSKAGWTLWVCSMYQVSVASIYGKCVQEEPREVQIIPDDVAVGLLIRNSFIQDLEQEVILRYTDTIGKEALMMREDVERIIPEALSHKKSYTLADVITACMMVNQKTLSRIRKIAIARWLPVWQSFFGQAT